MSARSFRVGDTAAMVIRYGAGLEKLRHGHVIALGASGVQVRFDESRETLWLRASQLRLIEAADPTPTAPKAAPALALVPAVDPPVAPAAAPSAPREPMSSVDALESQGIDPMAAWLSLGRELIGRAARDVERAETDVAHADAEVADARALLATTEAAAVVARDRLRDAVNRRAEIERRTGAAS